MNLLLVVDMQNDFANKSGTLYVKNSEKIVEEINLLMQKFKAQGDMVAATQDFHPKGHISFASTNHQQEFSMIEMVYGRQTMWPDHCVQNTWGAQFVAKLATNYFDQVFHKGMRKDLEMYSVVQDSFNNLNNEFLAFINFNNFERIYIVGVALDFCIKQTIFDLRSLNQNVSLYFSATKAIKPTENAQLIKKFKTLNVEIK